MANRSASPCIVWFRDDLRLSDHPALNAASSTGRPVICLYVFDEETPLPNARPLGGAARWWLAGSLRALQASLAAIGAPLVLRKGPAAGDHRRACARDRGRPGVLEPNRAGAAARGSDRVAAALEEIGVASQALAGDLLAAPSDIRSKDGRGLAGIHPVLAAGEGPRRSADAAAGAQGDAAGRRTSPAIPCESWRLEPTGPDWAAGLRESWQPGEQAARQRLKAFLDGRPSPAMPASATGPIARPPPGCPRICVSARSARGRSGMPPASPPPTAPPCRAMSTSFSANSAGANSAGHLLFDLPDLAGRNLQAAFDAFPWRQDDAALQAWQRGRTGYPIVDAGMRELWHTGVDAQPGADGGGVVPGQASADRLALRRGVVLGHAGRCRSRQQSRQLAMGRGLRRRCRALFPGVQSDPAGREVRSRRQPMSGAGCRSSARLPAQPDPSALDARRRWSSGTPASYSATVIRHRSSTIATDANARSKPMRSSVQNERFASSALHIGESGYRYGFDKPWGTIWTTTHPYHSR